jgi:hypothetical protein
VTGKPLTWLTWDDYGVVYAWRIWRA